MSDAITLSEVQEFIAGFWYHYDQGHFDELDARLGDEMEYLSRSDSGKYDSFVLLGQRFSAKGVTFG